MEIEVKGHSGCTIEIIRNKKNLLIQKSTSDPSYVDRLYIQAIKQRNACAIQQPFIRVPKITNITKMTAQMVVQMEYIYSKNFIDYFETAGFEQVSFFVNTIDSFVQGEIERSELQVVPKSVVVNKYQDVKRRISSNSFLSTIEEISGLIRQSEVIFTNLPDYLHLPIGVCHGDLTLSNILFNANHYYLIDFLDSFIESPLMDMVKLRQDTAHFWSLQMYEGEYDRTRFLIIAKKIDAELDNLFSQYDWYSRYYDTFQLMNLLRVLQYAHEESVVLYLIKEISSIIEIIKK